MRQSQVRKRLHVIQREPPGEEEDTNTSSQETVFSEIENAENHDSQESVSSTGKTASGTTENKEDNSEQMLIKRRRLHMDPQQCLDYQHSQEGAAALADPSSVRTSSKDPNRGMYPRMPRLKQYDDTPAMPGFKSASTMVKPDMSGADQLFDSAASKNQQSVSSMKSGHSKKKLTSVNNSLDRYFQRGKPTCTVSKPSDSPVEACNNTPTKSQTVCSPQRSPSVMYSPLKKVSDTVYIIDDSPPPKPASSQTQNSKQELPSIPAAKVLFNAQKNVQKDNKRPARQRKVTKKEPVFNRGNSFLYSKMPDPPSGKEKPKDSQDPYGLLGSGNCPDSEDEEGINYFQHLPLEIVENILCRLPLMDLLLNVNLVCRDWYDIISNPKFCPWKKSYFRVKYDRAAFDKIVQVMASDNFSTLETYLGGLIKHMCSFKPVTAPDMLGSLTQHQLYPAACDLIKERVPDCLQDETPNPWATIATIVILSEKVGQISEVISCLGSSQCTVMEVTECLYCIATFLFVFKTLKLQGIWSGMHYRVYYALYLYENQFVGSSGQLTKSMAKYGGQQSMMRYSEGQTELKLTHEQMRICKYNVVPGDIVKIIAFAGTGKTTTLLRYTQLRPSVKFLLVVYNTSVRKHAESRFPKNVTCKTGHSLAFKYIGWKYQKEQNRFGNLKVHEVAYALPTRKGENLFIRAKFVVETVNTFLNSADDFITTAHTPEYQTDDKGIRKPISHDMRMNYVSDAEVIWEKMKDLKDRSILMTHDGYLKLYHLRRPKIQGYDVILIDEAQDLTPAVADTLLNQQQPKILVGDPNQQIYAFRGAVNAMQQVNSSHTFYLTQSFRFGPEISWVGACLLDLLKGEKRKVLVGNATPGGIDGSQVGQLAIISRCNFTVFGEAVKKCCYSKTDERVAFVGGTDGFGFPMLQDIYTLMLPVEEREKKKRVIQNNFIKKFEHIGDLEKYATKTCDFELLGKIRIVKTYHHTLPTLIYQILLKTSKDVNTADIVLSTAHKSKGLEFSTVRVTDDFVSGIPGMSGAQNPGSISSEESNILYVAVTRAKKRLQLSPTLVHLLRLAGEQFLSPVPSKTLESRGVTFKCLETDQEFKPFAVTLEKKKLTLGDRSVIEGGLLGPAIVRENWISLRQLFGAPPDGKQENQDDHMTETDDEDYDFDDDWGPEVLLFNWPVDNVGHLQPV